MLLLEHFLLLNEEVRAANGILSRDVILSIRFQGIPADGSSRDSFSGCLQQGPVDFDCIMGV